MFFSFFAMGHTSINIQVVLVLTINSGRLKYILFQKIFNKLLGFKMFFTTKPNTSWGIFPFRR
jgi:hypothetical protein